MRIDPKQQWLVKYPKARRARYLPIVKQFEEITGLDIVELLEDTRRSIAKGQPPAVAFWAFRVYRNEMLETGHARTTVNTWYSVIRSFFTANFVALPKLEDFPSQLDSEYEPDWAPSQDEVRKMVTTRNRILDKAIIAFLAQTGQRVGVLTAMKRGMITRVGSHGIVEVSPRQQDARGEKVNKFEVRHKFVIGEDTMRLLDSLPENADGWLFKVRRRQISRIIVTAATDAGIQKDIPTKIRGRKLHQVHPHTFRRYFETQVKDMNDKQREFLMGHRIEGKTYAEGLLTNEKLIEAYIRVEPHLAVL